MLTAVKLCESPLSSTLTAASQRVQTKKRKKTTFFDFEKKGKNSRNFSFQLFAISEIYILLKKVGSLYIEEKS